MSYAATKKWRDANKEKHAAQQARYHKQNKDRLNKYVAQWKKDNWSTYKIYLTFRKKRIRIATPKWVDILKLQEIYINCPKGYHVDHIVPLNGKNVCGLHVPWNLQYLPAIENLRKGNKII